MAIPTLTETLDNLYSSTWQDVRQETINQVYTATPFWWAMTRRERIGTRQGGRFIEFNLEYAKNATVKSFSGRGSTLPLTDTEIVTRARASWRYLGGTIVRFFADDHQNRGKNEIFNLARTKVSNLRAAIIDTLETQAFADGTGNGGLDVDGLDLYVSTTPTAAGTVSGIDQVANTWWQNRQKTSTGAASVYMLSDMRNLFNTCSLISDGAQTISSRPNLLVTDQASFELYEDEILEMKRIISKEMADGGFEDDTLTFKGVPFVWSPAATAGQMYFLNTRRIEWITDSMVNFEMTSWKEAPNGLDRYAQIVTAGNFVVSNRQQQGVLTAIAA